MASIDVELIDDVFTDDELAELALAAYPGERLDADAVELGGTFDEFALLPSWYMPRPLPGARPKSVWLAVVAIFLVSAFVTITALGFCITYGRLEGV